MTLRPLLGLTATSERCIMHRSSFTGVVFGMERHMFLGVLAFSIVAVIAGVLFVPGRPPGEVHLPWQVEITPEGHSRVFGVEIGRTTLAEAEETFREPAEVSLFENKDGKRVVEVYFNNVDISGLRARMVLVMDLNSEQLAGMYQRGERLANMGGGRHKVSLSSADLHALKQMTFNSLSYIPRHNLDDAVVKSRFGEPAERIAESKGKVVHWLYPEKGLDIALNPEAKEVLQYVQPSSFEEVRRPLLEQLGDAKP